MATHGAKIVTAIEGLAVNLAIAGIQEMMAPDPSVDKDSPENYAFNGGAQNIKPGDPVPVLYGELRIPGRPLSMDVNHGRVPGITGLPVLGNGSIITIPGTTGGSENQRDEYNDQRHLR
jgi:hypothetical protein